jgi:mono/diheme cytochrome c family protein
MRSLLLVTVVLAWPELAPADSVDYAKHIKPILTQHCYQCHGSKVQKAGLRLDTVAALKRGGKSGAAIVPGKSSDSLLIAALRGADGLTPMPFKKPALPAAQVALLGAWIDAGAVAPAQDLADGQQGATHWAFVPPVRPPLPAVQNTNWVRTPIDAFILARLEKEGLQPSPEADRATLLRRLSLDLTGLLPAPAEVEAFVHDPSPDAYERVVDHLLASPHYGERWGRHWLDLARYADSNGYSIDAPREIWKYRDWVIDALNHDKPFDQFAIEQIAGDLLPGATREQRIATGFHRNTQINEEGGIDREQFRVEAVVDRVATTGQVFLGLTLGCCRCHDHKFDPFTQKEFYQLFAFFNSCDEPTLELASPEDSARRKVVRERLEKLEEELKIDEDRLVEAIPEAEREKYRDLFVIHTLGLSQRGNSQKQRMFRFLTSRDPTLKAKVAEHARIKATEAKVTTTLVLAERKQPRETYVHVRGDFTRKGAKVEPGLPGVLPPLSGAEQRTEDRGQRTEESPVLPPTRLDLARWLVDAQNPLTARVTVNRIWQHYFGKGIVETENDFGVQGIPPTHPELLDWLATEFMAHGWGLKAMHRLIVTSATYRQASALRSGPREADPTNRLLARQNRLRLEAEVIRDCGLTASGLLSQQVGGPSVQPPQPGGVYSFTQVGREWKADDGPNRYRRGLYTRFWRAAPYPALLVFDAPDSTASCTRRLRSNTPLQALTLLNDEAYVELAAGLAGRLLHEPSADDESRLRRAFLLCLSRTPTPTELDRLKQYFEQQRDEYTSDPDAARRLAGGLVPAASPAQAAAWVAVARVLLNLDEFITPE